MTESATATVRRCLIPECPGRTGKKKLFCTKHWAMIPIAERTKMCMAYRPAAPAEFEFLACSAADWIRDQEKAKVHRA